MTIRIQSKICASILIFLAFALTGCGGSSSSSGSGINATQMGGARQGKTLSLSGNVSTLAGLASYGSEDGSSLVARFNNPCGVTTDGINLYAADKSNHTIRKIVIATGTVTTLAGNPGISGSSDGIGIAASFNSPYDITINGIYLYVADTGNNTIRRVEIVTGAVTTIAGSAGIAGSNDGTGNTARLDSPTGITTDGSSLYVTESGNSIIRKIVIATGEVTTLAGSAGQYGSSDGIGATATFFNPGGITTDGTNLYLADVSNNTIRKVVIATGRVTTIAGDAYLGGGLGGSTDGIGSAARFSYPVHIVFNGGNLYVTDYRNSAIRKVEIATGAVSTFAGNAGSLGIIDGSGNSAKFVKPFGITTDGGALYITDWINNIRKVVISTRSVTTLTGRVGSAGFADSTGSAAGFGFPTGVTTDGNSLYIADTSNHAIRKVVIATGAVTTIAGTVNGFGTNDGIGSAANFGLPNGITTDGTNLFVTDSYNSAIRKIVIATGEVTTLAGSASTKGFSVNDGTGNLGGFNYPTGITTDGANLFVTDLYDNVIRKVEIASGVVTTVAGTVGASGSNDGVGSDARFVCMWDITTDGINLYVTDSFNRTIRKVVIASGEVTTLAGSALLSGSTDGIGSSARFVDPRGITTDGTNLYVSEASNSTIRKVVIATGAVTTIAGNAGVSGSTDGIGSTVRFNSPRGITTDGVRLYVVDRFNSTIRTIN